MVRSDSDSEYCYHYGLTDSHIIIVIEEFVTAEYQH